MQTSDLGNMPFQIRRLVEGHIGLPSWNFVLLITQMLWDVYLAIERERSSS